MRFLILNTTIKTHRVLALLFMASLSSVTLAQHGSATDEPYIEILGPLNQSRNAASHQVTRFSNWLDSFFGDERVFQESQKSHLKVNILRISEEGSEPYYDASVQAKLTLPNTEKRLKLIIESDPEDIIDSGTGDKNATILQAVESQQEQSIGLRYINISTDWFVAHTDVGVRYRSGFDTFIRFRLRKEYTVNNWAFRIAEKIFWYDSSGAGETTSLDIDYRFNDHFLTRLSHAATYRDSTGYFDLSQNWYLFQNLNQHRALVYQAGVFGISEPDNHVTSYLLSVRYRQQLHQKWLFFEVNPKITYPEETNFREIKSIIFKIEVLFGGA